MPNALCAHRSLLFALVGVHLGRTLALAETTALTQTPGTNVVSEPHQTRNEVAKRLPLPGRDKERERAGKR